jgi:hypothetical protein
MNLQVVLSTFADLLVRKRIVRLAVLASAMFALCSVPAMAALNESGNGSDVIIPAVAANQEDVASIDGLMKAFYLVVNVAPNQPRQWGRDRTLYSPWIRFVATSTTEKGEVKVDIWNHQDLVNATEPMVQRGFSEREIYRDTQIYGNTAHVNSTYETDLVGPNGVTRSRGVNSIEMYFDGRRWWISSVMWMTESQGYPIPTRLLPERAKHNLLG